jgi:hypothetical protein
MIDGLAAGPGLVVKSDQDMRTIIELGYYRKLVPPPREIRYVLMSDWARQRADWLIVHGEGTDNVPDATLVIGGDVWKRASYYGCSELSGQAWTVYHLEALAPVRGK